MDHLQPASVFPGVAVGVGQATANLDCDVQQDVGWKTAAAGALVAEEFPEIELEHLLVDAMAMHLLSRPKDFSVVVTENLFGDILTDEASMIPGSLGMLPSASLGEGSFGLYEPVHGSAPDIAGSGAANPLAAILSTALMLRHSLDCADEAAAIECAIESAVARGILPADLCRSGQTPASTVEVTQAVLDGLG